MLVRAGNNSIKLNGITLYCIFYIVVLRQARITGLYYRLQFPNNGWQTEDDIILVGVSWPNVCSEVETQ